MKGEKGCFLCEDKGDGVGNGLQRFWLYSTGMLLHMIPMEKLLSGMLFKMENRKCQYFLHRRDWEFLNWEGSQRPKRCRARKYMVHNKSSIQELKATTNEMDPQERTISQLSRRIIVQTKSMDSDSTLSADLTFHLYRVMHHTREATKI
ncbi:hypothetical protein ACROYT_G017452 [Oculina patagonica]